MVKMENKKLLVSFLSILAALFVVSTVSATTGGYNITAVVVNDGESSIVAGETAIVEVWFESLSDVYDKDVTVEVTIDADDFEVSAETKEFDVLPNESFKKTLRLEIPKEVEDKLLDDEATLEVEIRGDNYRWSINDQIGSDLSLTVKRTSDSVAIRQVSVPSSVQAGETIPVDVVLENIGFNDLDNLYVTVSIEALGVQQSGFFGDIVALECGNNDEDEFPWNDDLTSGDGSNLGRNCDEDDEDTISGRLLLKVPFGVKAGSYALNVEVENDEISEMKTTQVVVQNDFDKTVFKSGNSVWLVNPTDNVVGYRLVAESPASVSESIVFVPAGGSKSVSVEPNAEGEYDFDVNVFTTKGELVDTLNFSGSAAAGTSDDSGTSPVVILTVILAIIFVVLLVVLIVLIGKKPEKSGEFGESYY